MKFNINNKVRVKLTKIGHAIHMANHFKLHEKYPPGSKPVYTQPVQTEDGWSTWQFWGLMHEFGSHMHNGAQLPFETEIELLEE